MILSTRQHSDILIVESDGGRQIGAGCAEWCELSLFLFEKNMKYLYIDESIDMKNFVVGEGTTQSFSQNPGRADLVRRAMGKKKLDVMQKEREIFINGQIDDDGNVVVPGCVRNGIDKESANKIFDEMSEFAKYFKCTAYSPFSTLFWRDYDVYSKAGWDEGISVNDETGLLGKIPDANMIDGDPLNNEEAMNDTGIVCAPNGDYIFAYFSDFPAITDLMYPLILAINDAEIAM